MTQTEFQEVLKEAAESLSHFINCADEMDIQNFVHLIANDHRTLVQKKMRLCMLFIERLAKDYDTHVYDLRNEHACKTAKKICDHVDKYDRYMPRI